MKKTNFSAQLKQYRLINNMTVKDVVNHLHEQDVDISIKTLYGWESGNNQPSADNLMRLCSLYKITDLLATFGYDPPSEKIGPLSRKEQDLISSYRKNPNMQAAVDKILDINMDSPENEEN